ncbi:protein-glutamine gamma-glutamyltransferase K-like isoform X2 [Ostrea edulis]|uniref:protein-glutamine gamma-glutamyltransferase K-like isoform X2 n=1 Tax=Ostrea edulis TaxID=37623 RepID=UPI0024AEFEE8|nr:protein-glutamine gamma-glutamyltransferase K-like isoform X2 [Ostrea edulis]XP_048752165.2 protein-glutamine gamma-glutamyltransferase K-like isoform X2 [Ostrea edulis]XP_056010006.1 protein-glutamine gamma-glutamyltransferase K-like isoform X2 [Ostrea edulis]XP_056010041.1 protein-glutamine gamma-glutamyltransferase K-like isoform X2 [Ostrea edulis]
MPRRRRESDDGDDAETPPKRHRYNLRSRSKRVLGEEEEGRINTLSDEDLRARSNVLKPADKPSKALDVKFVDYQTKLNRKNHHSNEFEKAGNIIRRGQEFVLNVDFDREIKPDHDVIILQFTYGLRPQESKGSVIRIQLTLKLSCKTSDITGTWFAEVKKIDGKNLECSIKSAPDSTIGVYQFYVETNLVGNKESMKRHLGKEAFTILFNAWTKDDTVYMEKKEEREEYVLNETGRIWTQRGYFGRPWNFGQFDEPVLDVALKLLEDGGLSDVACTSPVAVIRCLSSLCNSCDSDGVLEGRWTSEYPEDCTKPWNWAGSVAIIKEYHSNGNKPVRYGQCWVFSGLLTTMCRCLGIPTRSVTNFDSAHDTDSSMTIDSHWDEDGEPIEDMNDSVWNFHVWNESWIRRLDLPEGYDGWQAHDATPQEASEGIMRCGPAPLKAIKEGHVYLNYDIPFIFGEVNGDRVQWVVKKDGTMEVSQIDHSAVGHAISTKRVGSNFLEDVTHLYKYQDGSEEERKVAKFVSRYSTRRKHNIYKLDTQKELDFTITTPKETLIGDDMEIKAAIKNMTDESRAISLTFTLINVYYTGVAGKRVKTQTFKENIGPKDEKELTIQISGKEYHANMNPEGRFQLYISGKNLETGRMQSKDESFMLKKPELVIQVPETIEVKKDTEATIVFKNTTQLVLTQAEIAVEGAGLIASKTIAISNPVNPGDEVKETVVLHPRPRSYWARELIASFTSKQIVDIETSAPIKVIKPTNGNDSDDD